MHFDAILLLSELRPLENFKPEDGSLVVAYLDGEFTLKRIRITDGGILLVPSNSKYPTIEVAPENDFRIWGVVSYVVKKV